ncbi:apolipoprotein N-acyltransferase [Pusillimonas sp. T2]|uniref:apolipoprotein N-acyltransferase n=1 Tax=Pusillimonas sp. T2 TaxID=1548123 RepID=UPI000B9D36F7|nr:apolipoprotein N-acyltransferase [Pusillimonas sp. T2]OXR50634.1 apolipoprotein N-acyltransferase [Pusillimonas sp. T2]
MRSNLFAGLNHARRTLQPLLIGAAHAFSFSDGPLPAWLLPYVQVLTLTFLALWVWRSGTVRQAALSGFLFGLGNFALGLYWIYISLHTYGGLHPVLSGVAVFLMAAGKALFVALVTGLTYKFCRPFLARLAAPRINTVIAKPDAAAPQQAEAPALAAPAGFSTFLLTATTWASLWMLAEWLRGTLFTGFPWMNIGYAHADGPFSGWASVLGVYGVAWVAAFTAGAIALLMQAQKSPSESPAAMTVVCAIGLVIGGLGLAQIRWWQPLGNPMLVRLVQGNIEQSLKFDPHHLQQGIDTYLQLAGLPPKEAGANPAMIILPETVIPLFQNRIAPQTWQRWLDVANARQATLLMGIPLHTNNGEDRYTNSVIAFNGSTPLASLQAGTASYRYDKHHLVPFGEFIPPGFRWFVDALNIPLGDFNRGQTRQPSFSLAGQHIAPNICYEDVFGEEIIEGVRSINGTDPGASLLVNVSNLAWFGQSWALQQHLQIARMRALETARPMLRATNTGMTAAIDPDGKVRAVLTPLQPGVLDVEVQGTQGLTPYVRWGNIPALLLALLSLATAALIARKARPE